MCDIQNYILDEICDTVYKLSHEYFNIILVFNFLNNIVLVPSAYEI
jgi:hypothetical protein